MTRTITALSFAGCVILTVGVALGLSGMALPDWLVSGGHWFTLAAFALWIPAAVLWIALAIVELTPWHRGRARARFQDHMDHITRRARLSAFYRLR